MKIFLPFLLFFFAFNSQIKSQIDYCNTGNPLVIKILDRFGFEKTTNFCEGEEVTFTVEGQFDRYIWGINNTNSDLNRAYSYASSLKIKLPGNQVHITINTYKKGASCYEKGSKLISNLITTQRSLLMPDSAYVGEDVKVSATYYNTDDVLFTPYGTFLDYSGFNNRKFMAGQEGVYKLVNERINQTCGNHDIERTIFLTDNSAKPEVMLTGPPNLRHCVGWLMEIGIKSKNLRVKNPQYTVYISSNPNIIKDNYYEQLAAIYTENSLIIKPDYKASGNYIFVREQLSGAFSNAIGPFTNAQVTVATKENLEILQYPQAIIAQGDSTIYQIKSNLEGKILWMDNGNIINENSTTLKIKNQGYYYPIFIYGDQCFNPYDLANGKSVAFFESLIPTVKVEKFCEKQTHLSLQLDESNSSKGLVTIKWKKDGKTINETTEFTFLATEIGNYSCEVWYKNLMIESNKIVVDFKNNLNRINAGGGPTVGNLCAFNDIYLPLYSDAGYYRFNNKSVNDLLNENPSLKINWFVNDILQENHSKILIPPTNLENISIVLLLKDENCSFISDATHLFSLNREIPVKKTTLNNKYEICGNETVKISRRNFLSENHYYGNEFAKYDWYKDGKYLFTKEIQGEYGNDDISITISEPGIYHVITTFLNKYSLNYDSSSCKVMSEPIEVTYKSNRIISSENYLKRLCPTDPILGLKLPNATFEKVEWFFNDKLIIDQPSNFSKTKDSTYIQLNEKGQYYAKISYSNECVTTSEKMDFDGTNDFTLISSKQLNSDISKENSLFCSGEYLFPYNFYEQNKLPLNYTWSLNGKAIQNPNYLVLYPSISGIYQLAIRHTAGTCTLISKPYEVILPNTIGSLSIPDSAEICAGSNLAVTLSEPNAEIIHWFEQNNPLSNSDTLIVKSEGIYKALYRYNGCESNLKFSNPLKINEIPQPTASISGSKSIDYNQSTDLKFELTSAPPWQIKLNTGEEFSINNSPYVLNVRPLSDIKYSIASVKNVCGLGTATGEAIIKVTILADEKSVEENTKLKVFPIPVTDVFELELLETNGKNCLITLTNSLGIELKNIFTKSINNKISKTLNINDLPAGLYNLNVKVGSKNYTRKILKK